MSAADRRRGAGLLRDWALVSGASVAIRAVFMRFKGPWSYSWDLVIWKDLGVPLARGQNVYRETVFFVWPPVWIQILHALHRIASRTGVAFTTVLPVFLIAVESALIATLLAELGELGARRRVALVFAGIAANPVCVVLVTQHGNFDVLVALLVVLCLRSLARFQASRLSEDWLFACLWLGLAIGLKTVPVLLAPLLLAGARTPGRRVHVLGAVLAAGPALYGLGVLRSVGVSDIWTRVLGYRSVSDWFGATGWFWQMRRGAWVAAYSRAFTAVVCLGCAALAAAAWRGWISSPRRLFASGALLLAAVPGVGPGYAPQYFYWFWPLVLVSFALGARGFRRVVVAFGVVAAATYLLEYALSPLLGAFLAMRMPSTRNVLFWEYPRFLREFTIARTPLWLAYLALLAGLAGELARPEGRVTETAALSPESASEPSLAPAGG